MISHSHQVITLAFGRRSQKSVEGVTAYTHTPAEGLWKDKHDGGQHDEMVIFEALIAKCDKSWWRKYKKQLETTFAQNEIMIRIHKVKILK